LNTAQANYNNMPKLSTRHLEIVRRVVCGQDLKTIAEEMGIHYQSVVCISNSPLFKLEKEKMIREVNDKLTDNLSDPKQYLNAKSLTAAKKLVHLCENGTTESIQLSSANSILDRGAAPKITKTEGEINSSLQIDHRVMKLLIVSKLEAGLIPDDQKPQALALIQEFNAPAPPTPLAEGDDGGVHATE